VERLAHGVRVPDVPHHELDVIREVVGPLTRAVDLRVKGIEDTDLVATLEQLVREMGADEAGTSRDQDDVRHEDLLMGVGRNRLLQFRMNLAPIMAA